MKKDRIIRSAEVKGLTVQSVGMSFLQ
jgi:hypothetical protein